VAALRLPLAGVGTILLLTPTAPQAPPVQATLPLPEMFRPLLPNLARAIQLCQRSERYTRDLIFERDESRSALRQIQERAQVTLDSIGDGVITSDPQGQVEYLNPVAEKLTGWSSHEAVGRWVEEVFRVVEEGSGKEAESMIAATLAGQVNPRSQKVLSLLHRSKGETPIEYSSAPIRDREGAILGVVLVFHDVSTTRKLTQMLSWQANHDPLTGLLSRRAFERRLEEAIASARRGEARHFLLYLDLDQFKVVNDTCGHVAGDELLRQLGDLLRSVIRERDALARLGGDEFGMVLEDAPLSYAMTIAQKLRQAIQAFRFSWRERPFRIGASIGIAAIDGHDLELGAVMSAADLACYAAKEGGRNRIHLYTPGDAELTQRRGEMNRMAEIAFALEHNQFHLYAQPIVPVVRPGPPGRHLEILVRMSDQGGRLLPPASFIPAAERYHLMPAIDQWVIREVFGVLGGMFKGGWQPQKGDLLSINLSGTSLNDDDLLPFIQGELVAQAIPPELICFEITETAAVAHLGKASKLIEALHKIGCRFSLDDFGSGLSSFPYLKALPVDFLKIDGGFVRDMLIDPIDRAMVESINRIGHVMGKRTIAEAVEQPELLTALEEIGVDCAQGFAIARPRPLHEVLALV